MSKGDGGGEVLEERHDDVYLAVNGQWWLSLEREKNIYMYLR